MHALIIACKILIVIGMVAATAAFAHYCAVEFANEHYVTFLDAVEMQR